MYTEKDIRNVTKFLSRSAELEYPEQRLMFGILELAIYDLMFYPHRNAKPSVKVTCRSRRARAAHFFASGRFAWFCDQIGLNSDFVFETLQKHGGLNDEMIKRLT